MRKWIIYQSERFPLIQHAPLIAVFSFCAVSISAQLREGHPHVGSSIVAFFCCLITFLHLRIADEFKDFEEDSQFRPYRPVPRGLVSLKELGWVWVGTAIVQFIITFCFESRLIWLLLLTWSYLALMSVEFFVRDWIKGKPVTYLLSHMLIMPLVDLFATASDWLPNASTPTKALFIFLVTSFFNGISLEFARKIRCKESEEIGVNTYTALWGRSIAVGCWLLGVTFTIIFGAWTASSIQFFVPFLGATFIPYIATLYVAFRFLKTPTDKTEKAFEPVSGILTLVVYSSLGILPLIF